MFRSYIYQEVNDILEETKQPSEWNRFKDNFLSSSDMV